MWMWPLDSAVGATTAHRTPERMADETCTWVWAWMTDKCRRRMNGRKWYITTKIIQRKGKQEGPEKWGRLLGCERSWEFPSSGEVSFLLGTLGRLIVCIFSPPKQVVALSKPNFWTHSLQIHYNGPGLKTETLQLLLMDKKWYQSWIHFKISNNFSSRIYYKNIMGIAFL